jgi:hypothetical protein
MTSDYLSQEVVTSGIWRRQDLYISKKNLSEEGVAFTLIILKKEAVNSPEI